MCVYMCGHVSVLVYITWLHTCVSFCMWRGYNMPVVRENPWVSVLAFLLVGNHFSLVFTAMTIRVTGLIASGDSPVAASLHLTIGKLV